jgi:hypothetical protein
MIFESLVKRVSFALLLHVEDDQSVVPCFTEYQRVFMTLECRL